MSKKQILRDAEDFQPDSTLLETQRPPLLMYLVWAGVLLLLGAGIAAAAFSQVDKIVSADGRIVTTRPNLTMKPLELTVIRSVNIRTGQKVRAGQVLFTFDQTQNNANLQKLREQLQSYSANYARLKAEARGYEKGRFELPEKPNRDQLLQKSLYDSRKRYYLEKMASYDESIRRYERTLTELNQALKKYTERQDRYREIEKMLRDLQKQKIVSLKDRLETEAQVLSLGIQTDEQRISIVENTSQILVTKAERNAFEKDWQREILEDLVSVERDLVTIRKEIPKAEMLCGYTELRSPCDAVVHELAPFQEGSAVREAEALVTLVPLNVEIRAEVDIPARDIGWVKVGDVCRLKLDTYPFQQHGALKGVVSNISQDAFTKDRSEGNVDSEGRRTQGSAAATYKATIRVSGELKKEGHPLPLLPGMRLKAEIKVGKRSVMNYLMNPFVRAMEESSVR